MQVKEFDCENYLLATDRIYATISDLKKLARNYEFEALEPMLSANEIPQRPPLLTVWPRFKTQNLEVPKVVAPPRQGSQLVFQKNLKSLHPRQDSKLVFQKFLKSLHPHKDSNLLFQKQLKS